MALLSLLIKYRSKFDIKLIVAHINHLIREESTEDEQFVENFCKLNEIEFYSKSENIIELSEKNKRGIEDIAREVRYNFFYEIMKKTGANKICIAHNKNDNAETVLMNIFRGTGISGLEGIKSIEYGIYIKPLINVLKRDIEDFIKREYIGIRIDKTNFENDYTRNKIRNIILPEISKINPSIENSIARLSEIIAEANDYIKNQVDICFNSIAKVERNIVSMELKELKKQKEFMIKNLIIKSIEILTGNFKNISKINIDDVLSLVKKGDGNKYIYIKKGLKAEIKNKKIFMVLT